VDRSRVFGNGRFQFVTLPGHLDPNWEVLTYGDCGRNPRARALLSAEPNDILLLWALLWRIPNAKIDIYESRDKGWYLIGALRIEEPILKTRENLKTALKNKKQILRAAKNAHTSDGHVEGRRLVRVFLGNPRHSARFDYAVDLGIYQSDSLLRNAVRTKSGEKINWHEKPHWNSVTRACRAILNLEIPEQRKRANLIRDAIRRKNPGFDLLAGL
jgi:hypothetical protein